MKTVKEKPLARGRLAEKVLVPRKPDSRAERNMMMIEALVRLGSPLHSPAHYTAVAEAFGVTFRVVRYTHEVNWPLCQRMMDLERDLVRIKGEYAELRASVGLPEPDSNPYEIEGRAAYPVYRGRDDERVAALKTLELCIAGGYVKPYPATT